MTAKEKEITGKFEAEILGEKIYNLVQTKGNLADSYKGEKFIRKMVVGEMFDKATEKGLQIDSKTLKVAKADGSPLFVKAGQEYGIDDLMNEVVAEDWKKKAEATDTSTVRVEGKPNGFARPDPVRDAMSKSMLT